MSTALPTIPVHVALRGRDVAGASVSLVLDRFETDEGFVVPRSIEGTTDADGRCTLAVWPNARGSRGSVYSVRIAQGYRSIVEGAAAFPADVGGCDLHAYLQASPYPPRDDYQSALVAAATQAAEEAATQAAENVVDIVKGAKGDKGDPGQIRFTGHGAPTTIIGAKPDDTYLDLDTGQVYKLT